MQRSLIDKDELNSCIAKLVFFIEPVETSSPPWQKLSNYHELEYNEFDSTLKETIKDFKTQRYQTPELFLHTIAVLIFFYKKTLSPFSVDEIKQHVTGCDETYIGDEWSHYTNLDLSYSFSSSYRDIIEPEFNEIFELIKEKNNELVLSSKKEKKEHELNLFLDAITHERKDDICDFLRLNYPPAPLLKDIDPEKFFTALTKCSNKFRNYLLLVLNERYSESNFLDDKPHYFYLNSESKFWKCIDEKIDSYNATPFKKLLFNEFKEHFISNTLKKLESLKSPP